MPEITISVETVVDVSPDTSYLGQFHHSKPQNQWYIDFKQNAVFTGVAYQCYPLPEKWHNQGMKTRFYTSMNHFPPGREKSWSHVVGDELQKVIDEHGSIFNADIDYALQDAKRLTDFHNDEWCYIGVIARVRAGKKEIGYGALWGVESDSGQEYIDQVKEEVWVEAMEEASRNEPDLFKKFKEIFNDDISKD